VRVMVTGANGQLGLCLQEQLQAQNIEYQAYSSSELDITNLEAARKEITNFRPDAVINTAAYTQVDKAESEPEKAYTVNCTGAENLAVATKEIDSILLHVSTDYVFDGTSTTPYKETDTTNPQCVYGLTKLQGEQAIAKVTEKYIILRTAWAATLSKPWFGLEKKEKACLLLMINLAAQRMLPISQQLSLSWLNSQAKKQQIKYGEYITIVARDSFFRLPYARSSSRIFCS